MIAMHHVHTKTNPQRHFALQVRFRSSDFYFDENNVVFNPYERKPKMKIAQKNVRYIFLFEPFCITIDKDTYYINEFTTL